MKLKDSILALVVASAAIMLPGIEAKKYHLDWTIPPGGAATYVTWASEHTLIIDQDNLVFDFKAGEHDLTIVTKENFDSCNTNNPLYQFRSPGVVVGASTPGTFYFTCSFAGHCLKGQKVAVQFVSSSTESLGAATSPSLSPSQSTSTEDVTTIGGGRGDKLSFGSKYIYPKTQQYMQRS